MKTLKVFLCIAFVTALPICSFCQQKGIQFEEQPGWKEIKAKAKAENKYIFVDCFTTWCGPCKLMEKNVYMNDSVGDYMNANFISIKLQMDTTKSDAPKTIRWYADGHEIRKEFHVNSFPTFLFFSPEGRCVHIGIGYREPQLFISLGKEALDPGKQYVTLKESYEKGKRDFSNMASLAITANSLGDAKTATTIAKDYIDHYLFQLKEDFLYTKENIGFISQFVSSTTDSGFNLFYLHANQVNRVMGDSMYAQRFVVYLITKSEIDPELLQADKLHLRSPDWRILRVTLAKDYNEAYADRVVTEAQVRWYGYKKDWPEFTKSTTSLMEKFGFALTDFELENHTWNIFLYSTNKSELEAAVSWISIVLQREPNSPAAIDTYANLLYKLGKPEEGLIWENKAVKLDQEGDKQIADNLNKMMKGEPTWILK